MARDAISRQYDVDRNKVTLTCEEGTGNYRPGIITFAPKPGKSLDLRKLEESIRATRLSAGTNMSVDYLDITATGSVLAQEKQLLFQVSGTAQQFVLKDTAPKEGETTALQRLRAALDSGADLAKRHRPRGWVEGTISGGVARAGTKADGCAGRTGSARFRDKEEIKAMKDTLRNLLGALLGAVGAAAGAAPRERPPASWPCSG